MADLRLNVVANTRQPRTEIESLRRDIQLLRTQTNQTQQSTTAAGQAVDRFGDEAREAAMGVTTLGRSIFQTSEQAKRFDGVFRATDGRLREANGRYVKGREALDDMGRSFGGASGGAQVFTRSLSGLGGVLSGLGIAAAGVGVLSFGASTVRAAAQMEALERGLRLVEGSAAAAEMRLETLQILANLPGLQLAPLVRYNNILREVGLTTGEVDTVVTSLGNAIVSFGGNAETVDRVFTQLSQSFSQNKLEAEEFNTVLESVPSLRGIIQDVLGLSGGTQELGEAFKAAGGDLIDFLLPVFERLQTEIPTAPLDSYAASVDTLGNSFTQLQAVIGEGFLPVIGSAARGLAGFLDNIREGIEGTKNFTEVIAELNAELTRASGTIELREAIDEGVDALEAFIRQSEAAIRNNSVFFGAREDAILIGQINQANEALTEFVGVQERNIETEAELRAELVKQEAELARIQGLQTDRNNLIAEQGRTAERASRIYLENLTKEEIAVNASIDDLEKKLTAYEAIPPAIEAAEEPTEAVTEKTKELTTEVLRLTEVYNGLTRNIQQASEQNALIAGSGVGDFFRLVRGEIEAYNVAIDTVIPSIFNLTEAQDALTASIDANIGIMQTAIETGTDLDVVLSQLSDGLTSTAADQAIANAEFRLVNPAVSEAVDSLRDYNDVMLEAGINFRTTEEISQDLTQSIRDQASAFDDLRGDVESAEISLDDIDATFNRIPNAIDPAIVSMEDFETVGLRALRSIGDELSAFEGDLGGIGVGIDNLVTLFANPVNFAAGTLGAVIEGLANINEFGGALGLPEGFFDDPVPRAAQVNPQNIVQGEQLAQQQVHQAGIARNLNVADPLSQIEILRGNDPGIFQRFGTREFIEQNFPELVGVIYPSGQGFNQSGALAGRRTAQSLAEATGTDRQFTEDIARQQYGGTAYDAEVAAATAEVDTATPDTIADNVLADALRITQEAIGIINTGITRLENVISQSNDPAEIANLLDRIADQIPESYRLRREALQQQFDAGEITLSALNNGIANLNIEESAAIERNSDAQLANTLLINQTAQNAIATQVSALQQAISQSNDPVEIANLLQQIAAQIPKTYRLKRNALSQQFAAGEITAEQFQNGYAALDTAQAAEVERNSDAMLTNTLRANQDAQNTISVEISALEQAIATSNDPTEITGLLMQIAEQIPEKYRLRREALQAQFDAGEITITELQNGLGALDIQQAAEFEQNSDAILTNALRDHNADVIIISNAIHRVSTDIRNSDDPAEIVQLVESLSQIIMEKFRLQREFLQKRLDAEEITVREFQGQLGRLDIQETGELGAVETLGETRISTITRPAPSVSQRSTRGGGGGGTDPAQAAQRAADEAVENALQANQDAQNAISVGVSALENAISESNDPTEITGLLMQIAEQIPETYRLRREALQTQFDAGKITQGQLDNGLGALDIEQSAAIEQNSDAILTNALRIISEAAAAISVSVSALETQIAQSNDPTEIATLLMQIAEQIPETHRLRREALQAQFDAGEITLSALETGLAQINIAESAAIEQNSDARLTNALTVHNTDIQLINNATATLESRILNSNDPAEIARLTGDLGEAIMRGFDIRRQIVQDQLDAQEISNSQAAAQIGAINIQETDALSGATALGERATTGIAQEANAQAVIFNNLLFNAIQRAETNLTGSTSEEGFETRRGELITAINEFYDAEEQRISQLMLSEDELQNLREDNEFDRQRAIERATDADNRFRTERISGEESAAAEAIRIAEMERDAKIRAAMDYNDALADLDQDRIDAEMRRLESLANLAEDHQDRLVDIARGGLRRREDLQREFSRDFADNIREEQEQIAELLSGEGFDTREIQRFLQGFEGNVRGRLGEDALSQLNEIQREQGIGRIDLRRERDLDLEDIGIREGRRVEDAERRFTASQEDIHARAEATAAALTTALAPLLGMQAMLTQQQQDTAVLENVTATNTAATAATQVRTAMKEETNAAMTAATARVESNTAARRSAIAAMEARLQEQTATNTERFGMGVERFVEIPDLFLEVGERLTMSADRLDFSAAALTQSAELWATALGRDLDLPVSEPRDIGTELAMGLARDVMTFSADIVNINANSVNLNADIAGGVSSPQTPTRPVQRTVRNDVTLEIDGQTLGRIVDEVLVRLDTNGATLGQYVRRRDD